MTHLTREQLAAIHAAKKAGLTKKELFEFDVIMRRQHRRPLNEKLQDIGTQADLQRINDRKEENERRMALLIGKPIERPKLHGAERIFTQQKAIASLDLLRSQKAKQAFLEKNRGLSQEELERLK